MVEYHLSRVQLYPLQNGLKNFSLLDIASNVVLFIPFGFLFAAGAAPPGRGRRWLRVLATVAAGFVFSTLIEAGQLFTPGRVTSGIDVEADTLGALLGAVAAVHLGNPHELFHTWREAIRREPRALPLGVVAFTLLADRFYPFAITLDVSTLAHNFRAARWLPFRDPPAFWGDPLMNEVIPAALLAALVRSTIERYAPGGPAALGAWFATVVFGLALEVGKLFFVGRSPSVENAILVAGGALLGTTIPSRIWAARSVWLLMALAVVVHAELTPFEFVRTAGEVRTRVGRIEWLPLFNYFHAHFHSALFDLWNKLVRAGFLGFAVAAFGRGDVRLAVAVALFAGGVLEALQILTVDRTPSLTDVLIFGLGGWLGAAIHRARGERNASPSSERRARS